MTRPPTPPANGGNLDETPPLRTGYEILEELGRGSYGRVYRALDRALGREVALKVQDERAGLSASEWDRFVAEARTLASLDHKNIVRIHSIDEQDGLLRLGLELIDGHTLQDLVNERGPLSGPEAARVGIELCRALAAIHAEGFVHSDLKPANVMRARGGRVVLLDFGFARGVGNRDRISRGTPRTMSPEHFAGLGAIGPASDLYSLGVVLYWLVSGSYPHEATHLDELRVAVLEGRVVPLRDRRPDVPDGVLDVVKRAMAVDPSERYTSAGEMEQDLRDFVSRTSGAIATERAAPPEPVQAQSRGRYRSTVLLLLASIAATVAVAVLGRQDEAQAGVPPLGFVERFYAWQGADEKTRLLGPGSEVSLSEELFLEIDLPEDDVHVYVFNQDGTKIVTLFPLEGWSLQNPLAAGSYRLPGERDGFHENWLIDSVGTGEEEFLIVVSRGPNSWAERIRSEVPEAGEALSHLGDLRGVGDTVRVTAADEPGFTGGPRLRDIYRLASLQGATDSWRYIHLVNKGDTEGVRPPNGRR